MSKRKVVYISPTDKGKWSVKNEGSLRAIRNFENKKAAVDFGRNIAKRADLGQLKIQRRNGTFQREYTYRKDPFPPEG
jgi:hypothetical protein